jgi:hypothetical protein
VTTKRIALDVEASIPSRNADAAEQQTVSIATRKERT